MAYSKEAHELLDQALAVLKTKTKYPYERMTGYLMPNVTLEDAQRIYKLIEEFGSDN